MRTELGEKLGLIDKDRFAFCFIVDFPMYEIDEETGKLVFTHNPFSMPQGGLQALESEDPESILAYQYDIVVNGVELSSGAVRNHDREIMVKAFSLAGYTEDDLKEKFGALYNAFGYGAPPPCRYGPRRRPHGHAAGRRRKHPRSHCVPAQQQRPGSAPGCSHGRHGTAAAGSPYPDSVTVGRRVFILAAKVTKEELRQIATLSKLFIPEEEEENLLREMESIIAFADTVNEAVANTDTSFDAVTPLCNVFRGRRGYALPCPRKTY